MPHKQHYTEFTPELYPPFPENPEFKQATLPYITLKKLLEQDLDEEERLFEACKGRGFFYLNLRDCENGETILNDADRLCLVAEETFGMPMDEKMAYKPNPPLQWGYKYAGTTMVNVKEKVRDTAEFFNVSKTDMIMPEGQTMEYHWPESILKNKALFQEYFKTCHDTSMMMMSVLARKLDVDPAEITERHRFEEPSGNHIRLIRGPPRKDVSLPEIATPMHTDLATITILMNWLGGLQVWSESCNTLALEPDVAGEWHWVKPKDGCAIVILGDAAVKLTNGVLSAGHHRVIPAPGEQGLWPRYSLVHFLRPEDKCTIKTLQGSGISQTPADPSDEGMSGKQWIIKQAMRLRAQYVDVK